MEKRDITVDVVVALLREQFPRWADLAVRPVAIDGNDNTSFRLGEGLLVRLPSHERYVAGVEKEHRWLPILGSQLPLPIPEPVARGEPSDGVFPRPWSIYRWIDGEVAALAAPFRGEPVWVHGDMAQNNLLVEDGRLCGVIDFGTSGVGDPACDTVLAWTFLDGTSRRAFRDRLPVDDDTWTRGRAWAMWKALITLAWNPGASPAFTDECRRVLDAVIAEHHAGGPRRRSSGA